MHGFVKDFASRSIKLRCIYIRAIAFFDNWFFLWTFYSKVGGFEFKFIPIMSMVLSWVCSRSNKCHLRSIQASGDIRHQITCLHISTVSYVHKMSFLVILHLALCNYHIRLFRWNCMWHPSPPPLPVYLIKYTPPPPIYIWNISPTTLHFKSYFFKIMPMHVSLCLRKL